MSDKTISAAELDARFDAGEEISTYVDWSTAQRPGRKSHRVNVDFPQWMVMRLDHEAAHRGVTRQALIKMWLADRLDVVPTLARP